MSQSDFRAEVYQALFESAPSAMILATRAGAICSANTCAEKFLSKGAVLSAVSGRLEANTRSNRRILEEALAIATPRPRVYALKVREETFGLTVRSGPRRGELVLLSIRPCALPPIHRLAPLIAQFGLTKREIRMLRLLVSGHDVSEASAIMRVATSTGRTYVKYLYSKLDVRTRAQMASLVLRFCMIG